MLLSILKVKAEDLPPSVVVVGDPARAETVAARLENATLLADSREYRTISGSYNGSPVAVVSHGVGAAGAAVAFQELCRSGVSRIIRAGTAGGMQEFVTAGDIVIASAAVREDGFTDLVVPVGYPAVASHHVTNDLEASARARKVETRTGTVLTSSLFYPMDVLGGTLELWQRAGVTAVEMECAALFVVAAQAKVEAGAVLAIDGNPLANNDGEMTGYNPNQEVVGAAVEHAITLALDAATAR